MYDQLIPTSPCANINLPQCLRGTTLTCSTCATTLCAETQY